MQAISDDTGTLTSRVVSKDRRNCFTWNILLGTEGSAAQTVDEIVSRGTFRLALTLLACRSGEPAVGIPES